MSSLAMDGDATAALSLDSQAVTLDPLAPFRLDGKVAIVTGASAGLGRAVRARARRGRRAGRARGAGASTGSKRSRRSCATRTSVACDLAEDGAPEALVAADARALRPRRRAREQRGHERPDARVRRDDRRTSRATLRVNLVAPFELARECARAMIAPETGGAIVNVASIWGLVGVGQIPEAGLRGVEGRPREPHARARGAVGAQGRARELPRARAGSAPR